MIIDKCIIYLYDFFNNKWTIKQKNIYVEIFTERAICMNYAHIWIPGQARDDSGRLGTPSLLCHPGLDPGSIMDEVHILTPPPNSAQSLVMTAPLVRSNLPFERYCGCYAPCWGAFSHCAESLCGSVLPQGG